MDEYRLYETAMQVVPVLLIALFVDNRSKKHTGASRPMQIYAFIQEQLTALLGFLAFFVSMFVLSGGIDHSRWTKAAVVAGLAGASGLLFALVWQRMGSWPKRRKRTPGTAREPLREPAEESAASQDPGAAD